MATAKDFDFDPAKRGAVLRAPGKTRITIMLDNDTLDAFRGKAHDAGTGYQTLINDALREVLQRERSMLSAGDSSALFQKKLQAAMRAMADLQQLSQQTGLLKTAA